MWRSTAMQKLLNPRQGLPTVTKRSLEISAIERAVGQYAAHQFLESMKLESKHIVSIHVHIMLVYYSESGK